MNKFKPYYLYFLDRELLSTLGLYGKLPIEAVLHDTKLCLLSTPFSSYCSLSLIQESDYANSIYNSLLPAFKAGHIFLNMSGAKSLFAWAQEKRRQYKHSEKTRYFRYLNDDWEKIAEDGPKIHFRKVDTTSDLSIGLDLFISKHDYKKFVHKNNKSVLDEAENISSEILEAIHCREDKAITKELLEKTYDRRDVSAMARTAFDMSISLQYVSSQLREFGATIPVNGQLPIHEFDDLTTNYPLNNIGTWQEIYTRLGLFNEFKKFTAQDLVAFRESEVFEPLLCRISDALDLVAQGQLSQYAPGLQILRKQTRSTKRAALSRAIDMSEKLLSSDWPYEQKSIPRRNKMSPTPDPKKVFVVHGRDLVTRNAIFSVLDALGLRPLEWIEALSSTQNPSPYIGDVLDIAMKQAQAIVVLLTGDDEAKLKKEFLTEEDGDQERFLTPQPRPNVIFEAGMALGQFPTRTILVSIGRIRAFSDIEGRHVLRWNNSSEARHSLAERLTKAGCEVNTRGSRWLNAGLLAE